MSASVAGAILRGMMCRLSALIKAMMMGEEIEEYDME